MRVEAKRLTFSPSDLTAYLECQHLARLETEVARGSRTRPVVEDRQAELVRRKGTQHEAAYLAQLRSEHRDIVEIELAADSGEWDWERAAIESEEAIRAGREVVYQGVFVEGAWRGVADFVVRQADGSYEATDTKLARHGKPSHVLQLCFYSEQIRRITGAMPRRMHIALGSGESESYRVGDFLAYFRRVRNSFVAFADNPPATEPYPVPHCSMCDFRELCEAWWDETDHLVRVAHMRRDQVARLRDAGITTLADLGSRPRGSQIPRMAAATLENLRHQAELQLQHRTTGSHQYNLLEPEEKRGLGLLPKPSEGDLFFDMEGDPFWEPSGGLEYLFGVMTKTGEFRALWAHSREDERRAFEEFVDFVQSVHARDPNMHVYHYAAYEPSTLKRLMSQHATREDEVDDLLRKDVFVDLYAVVRQAMRISYPNYSIKTVERFYMERESELRAGDDSILLYERWVDERDDSILNEIRDYNREDCLSTLLLRDWLLDRKAEAEAQFGTTIAWRDTPEPRAIKPETAAFVAERHALCNELFRTDDAGLRLAALLLDYHRREAKPVWWQFFARLSMTVPELVEDAEAIGGLELIGEPQDVGKSREYTFSFPPQQHRLDPGDEIVDPLTGDNPGWLVDIDEDGQTLRLKRGPKLDQRPIPRALIPGGAWDTTCQREALLRFAVALRDGDDRYHANESILRRVLPLGGERVQVGTLEERKRLPARVGGGHLFVQGPPGSGKTWTGARLIVHLLDTGARVGVASTSHKAIHNLLREVERAAKAEAASFVGVKKSSGGNAESRYEGPFITSSEDVAPANDIHLYAGTAWLFARPEFDQALDYLFIDEAGQVSLADALAMGTSARTIVLLGDPMQLSQVRLGVHPQGSGASVLEHLLGDAETIREDRGLFLDRSWRMNPEVCRYISDAFYENRLEAAAGCERQSTSAGVGLRFIPVEHVGNRQFSPEEADAIGLEIDRLVGLDWTDAEGVTRRLHYEDIMLVAPYNEQVRWLKDHLPARVAVGTVDKFQGQEAPIVFFSMTTSSGEDVPRNLEFLLSRNRLNVAISRARCLAYLVASPQLLEVGCRSIEQMRMANALCLFVEHAEGVV